MGNKALIRVLILFVVVGAIALIIKLTGPGKIETVQSSTDREKVFDNFALNDVAQIRIKKVDGELNLKKTPGGWAVAERENYPADAAAAVDLLRSVWDLKIVQSPEIGPSQYERLALVDPAKGSGESSATVVSFLDADGKEMESLWLGKLIERKSGQPSPYGPSTTEVGRYVKTGSEDSVFLVSATFDKVQTEASDWLDEAFFGISKLKSIAIDSGNAEEDWKLAREEENGDFTLEGAKDDEELDNLKVSSMKNAFSSPRFEDVIVGAEATENAPGHTTFSIATFDGLNYTVKLSEKNDLNEFYLTYDVTGDFPEKREPQEEETDEETKQRDEEFAATLQVLKDKLAEQKKMAGKVYRVRSYVADALVKKREEILKTEEDAAPGGAGPNFTPGATPGGLPGGLPSIPGLPPGITPAAPAPPTPTEEAAPEKKGDAPQENESKEAPEAPAPAEEEKSAPETPAPVPSAGSDAPDPAGESN